MNLPPECSLLFTDSVPGGTNWSHVLKRGTTLRLLDTAGGANVSLLAYNAHFLCERLNLPDTLKGQHTAKLTAGHCLYSDMGRVLLSIPRDSLGWHDALAGHSTPETVAAAFGEARYQEQRNQYHRNARDGFLQELGKYGMGLADLVMNVNFFSKVTVDADGRMAYVANHSSPGGFVDLRAEMDTLVVLNTSPHPLHPGGGYPHAPVELSVFRSPPPGADDICRRSRPENARAFENTERYHL